MVEEKPQQPLVSAKEEILGRVRSALSSTRDARSDYAYIPRQYISSGSYDQHGRVELFIDRLQDYGATIFECNEASIQQAIGAALQERQLRTLVVGREFPGGWIPGGYDFITDRDLSYGQLDSVDGVVTRCALAIAQTGTIILRHAEEEPRRAVSLIPDYHLCIVFASQVVETVSEGVRQMELMGGVPLTTISGPSATSDIEMTRVKGVHGPRTLDVVMVL